MFVDLYNVYNVCKCKCVCFSVILVPNGWHLHVRHRMRRKELCK